MDTGARRGERLRCLDVPPPRRLLRYTTELKGSFVVVGACEVQRKNETDFPHLEKAARFRRLRSKVWAGESLKFTPRGH